MKSLLRSKVIDGSVYLEAIDVYNSLASDTPENVQFRIQKTLEDCTPEVPINDLDARGGEEKK